MELLEANRLVGFDTREKRAGTELVGAGTNFERATGLAHFFLKKNSSAVRRMSQSRSSAVRKSSCFTTKSTLSWYVCPGFT